MTTKDYNKSEKYWNHILTIEKNSITSFIALTEINLLKGNMSRVSELILEFENHYPDHAYMYFMKGLYSFVCACPSETVKLWRRSWGKNKEIFKENSKFLHDFLKDSNLDDLILLLRNCFYEKQFKNDVSKIILNHPELPLFEEDK